MRRLFLLNGLLVIVLLQNSIGSATALGDVKRASAEKAGEQAAAAATPAMKVHLSTATGKTIVFKAGEPKVELKADSADNEIPHLVLNRNGVPTPGFERTLIVSVDDLVVPPAGLFVQLFIDTQHGDPDLDRRNNVRIRVRKETKFISRESAGEEAAVEFRVTFDPTTTLPHKTIKTPTDYYRYRITVSDAEGNQLQSYGDDYAFLMENQWRVPLPAVLEATPGAAPNELVVYYYDMLPFQSNLRDPDTRIPRQEIGRYIQTELIPAMVEAFQVQSNLWEFPWYEEWHNFRLDEDPKTLSVALGEHQIWFHGKPASLGHSMISIRVDGTLGEYESLTDGIMSTFHHELFHNLQRNIGLHYNRQATVAGKDRAWMVFSEGTAVLASSVGQPSVQFDRSAEWRSYLKRANAFIGSEGATGGGLNKSYKDIPYHTALYWRFLYENCGGIGAGGEDPATGMQVIRRVLETLYAGEIVQIETSTDVARALPLVVDHALKSTPSCAFGSYEESLTHFARAIYQLRLEDGRCAGPIELSRCGLADPNHVYQTPPAEVYSLAAGRPVEISGAIPSSYGIDLVDLMLEPSTKGKTLTLIFASQGQARLEYNIEIWKTATHEQNRQSAQAGGPDSVRTENGQLVLEIENVADGFDGLGIIITRLDPHEDLDASGEYRMQLIAG